MMKQLVVDKNKVQVVSGDGFQRRVVIEVSTGEFRASLMYFVFGNATQVRTTRYTRECIFELLMTVWKLLR